VKYICCVFTNVTVLRSTEFALRSTETVLRGIEAVLRGAEAVFLQTVLC